MVVSFLKNGSFLVKCFAFNFETPFCDQIKGIAQHYFYTKEVMNSAQYHEEKIFVQVNNRDDKILPFQLQLSSIALLSVICSIYLSPLTGMFKFKFQVSNRFIVL